MAKEQEKKKKVKISSAIKRDLQSEKRRLSNRIYRSRARTAIRAFHDTLEKGDAADSTEKLNEAYSILDKCVQKGIYKLNKAIRTKSRLAAKACVKV